MAAAVLRSRAARRSLAAVAAVAAVALAVAACGGSSSSSTASSPYAASGAPRPAAATTSAASVGSARSALGKMLVDGKGNTLYLFEADKTPASMCNGACATDWPPLTTSGKAAAGKGVAAAKLGTSKRGDGTSQVTYNGHPLYLYAGDTAPGQTAGEAIDAFGAEWYVVSPAGAKIEDEG